MHYLYFCYYVDMVLIIIVSDFYSFAFASNLIT